jgi:phytoene dehydrogenase-like protein
MRKKVLVIGGGVAGLSVGSYLAMNDFDVEIFEMNRSAGGVCNAWQRGDYTIDLCAHLLVGAGPASTLYEKWNELAPVGEIGCWPVEEYLRVEDSRGRTIRVFTNPDRLEKELLEQAPEDAAAIHELTGALRKLADYEEAHEKPPELTGFWERVREYGRTVPYLSVVERFSAVSLEHYAAEFSNPLLQKVILNLSESRVSAILPLLMLSWIGAGKAGYPKGGAAAFTHRILDRFQSLGGSIRFQHKVAKILVQDDSAVGVELEDGRQIMGDYIISAADGHATLFDLLKGAYTGKTFEKFYKAHRAFPSMFYIALGVRRDLSMLPAHILFPIGATLVIDPETIIDNLSVRVHHFDPSLAPVGKTLVSIGIRTANYKYWQNLQQRSPEKYTSEKERISQAAIRALDRRFGDFAAHVEMIDVATPGTIIGFTNNWQGSFEGWIHDPKTGLRFLPYTLPKLGQFYMCGQWIAIGGGLPGVLLSARDVAQLICHAEQRDFQHFSLGAKPALP